MKLKERIKHWLLEFLDIEYWIHPSGPENKIDILNKQTGIGYIRFVKYGEYTGEPGTMLERLERLERKVFKRKDK